MAPNEITMNYKPPILRTFSLSCLFVVTLALLASIEYANRKLPKATASGRSATGISHSNYHVSSISASGRGTARTIHPKRQDGDKSYFVATMEEPFINTNILTTATCTAT